MDSIVWSKNGWTLQKADAYYLSCDEKLKLVMSIEAFQTMEISIIPYPKFVEIHSMGQLITIIPR